MKVRKLNSQRPQRRDSSPELGSPSRVPQYDKRTGRPIRRGAGKKQGAEEFVDSGLIEDEEAVDSLSEDDEGNPKVPKRVKKRKRTPSPPPPPLPTMYYDEESDLPSDDDSIDLVQQPVTPIVLQFNVPIGFHGPLVVKLDRELLEAAGGKPALNLEPSNKAISRIKAVSAGSSESTPELSGRAGFTDLPAELRNKVYRMVFCAKTDFNFHRPDNFCMSSQFIRTCRMVHSEGCSILYGENRFIFERNRNTRAPFWDPVPKEIGYKDVRQFLKMIGPENLLYLRDIKIAFEDANPGSTPYLTHEERRYLNDEQLYDVLRTLRATRLRKLTLSFFGRRTLLPTDTRFLAYLEQVKADEVLQAQARWYPSSKIYNFHFDKLKKRMVRDPKLYVTEEEE